MYIIHIYIYIYLVGGIPTPLKHMSSSVGMLKFPTEWKNKIHVPNHQPDIYAKVYCDIIYIYVCVSVCYDLEYHVWMLVHFGRSQKKKVTLW